MERTSIGSLSASRMGLGCNNFGGRLDRAGSERIVAAALDAGIDFFDTADVYGNKQSEQILGAALRGVRDRVVIATLFGAPNSADEGCARGSRQWIERAAERSLERLGTDYIDLYQMHFPDPDVPIEETLGALDSLVQSGKVREVGCSNFGSGQIRDAARVSEQAGSATFRTVQNRYSVLHREPEAKVVPACRELGVGLIPYFPLESGLLTGKYREGEALPDGTRLAEKPEAQRGRFLADGRLGQVERLRLRRGTRSHAAGTGDLLARDESDCRLGHRRRNASGASRSERGRRTLGPDGCRARGDRVARVSEAHDLQLTWPLFAKRTADSLGFGSSMAHLTQWAHRLNR